jgi:GT2 family glycosyltransferase
LDDISRLDCTAQIFIWDNASSSSHKRELDVLFQCKENINIHFSHKNFGFAAGVNAAIRKYKDSFIGDFVVFLNQDAKLLEIDVSTLINPLINCELDIVAPNFLNLDETSATESKWLLNESVNESEWCHAKFIPAAFWCIRLSIFLEMGGFDERFFMYGEDLDFCNRMVYRGKKIGVNTGNKVIHPFNKSQNYILEATFIFSEFINPNKLIVTRYLRMFKRIIFGLMKENAKYIKVVSLLIEMSFRKKNYLTK